MVVSSISDILRTLNIKQYSKKIYLKPHEYYWMRHAESCANVVKKTCKEDKTKCKEILEKYREKKEKIVDKKPHLQVKNPNISTIGIKQCRSVNANITKSLYGDSTVQEEKVKKLEDTIVFCSTLVRAIETAVLTSGKTNISYAYFSLNKDEFIEHVKAEYLTTIFVIPYIKEKDHSLVLKIQTSDNTATDFCDSMYRLTTFFQKLNIKIYFSNKEKSSQKGGEIIIKDKTQALTECNEKFKTNENFTKYEKLKNISDYSLFRKEIESEIIKPLLNNPSVLNLNNTLPLYIVSHQGFILDNVLKMSKDEDKGIYIKNCNVVSNLPSNEFINPEFKPEETLDNNFEDKLNDKFCLITPSTDTISLDKKISRIKYILELSEDEHNIIQGYKNIIIELETQIKNLTSKNTSLYKLKELIQTEMDFYYDMVILISFIRYVFNLKGNKINGKIDKHIEISDRKKDFFNKYISYIIKFIKSLINLNFKYNNETNLLTFNIDELQKISNNHKQELYILFKIDYILQKSKIHDLINSYHIIVKLIKTKLRNQQDTKNIDFLNIKSINPTNITFYFYSKKIIARIMKYPLLFKEYTELISLPNEKKNKLESDIQQLTDIVQSINTIETTYFTDTNETIQKVKNIIGDKIFAYYLDNKIGIGKNIHIEDLFERLNEKLHKFNFLFNFLENKTINSLIRDREYDKKQYTILGRILDKEYKPKIINKLARRKPLSYLSSVLKGYHGVEKALLDEINNRLQNQILALGIDFDCTLTAFHFWYYINNGSVIPNILTDGTINELLPNMNNNYFLNTSQSNLTIADDNKTKFLNLLFNGDLDNNNVFEKNRKKLESLSKDYDIYLITNNRDDWMDKLFKLMTNNPYNNFKNIFKGIWYVNSGKSGGPTFYLMHEGNEFVSQSNTYKNKKKFIENYLFGEIQYDTVYMIDDSYVTIENKDNYTYLQPGNPDINNYDEEKFKNKSGALSLLQTLEKIPLLASASNSNSTGGYRKLTRKQPTNSKYKTKKNPTIHKGNQSKKRGITKGNHKSKKRS